MLELVPQSMVGQCEEQKQRLGLVEIMEFLGRYFMLGYPGGNGMFE